eukprot:PLAT7838.1.p1 GENE.PLAT7838.1~~PLAT7838.1.p1  ORF type:complete len:384 (+),score=119.18 PLAT7838.1:36-1154(+)
MWGGEKLDAGRRAEGEASVEVKEEEVYENERWGIGGWGAPKFGTPPWTRRSGESVCSIEEMLPPSGWAWVGDWKYDGSGKRDEDGWEYAFDFSRFKIPTRRVRGKNMTDGARRRRWIRKRRRVGLPADPEREARKIREDGRHYEMLTEGIIKAITKSRRALTAAERLVARVGSPDKDSRSLRRQLSQLLRTLEEGVDDADGAMAGLTTLASRVDTRQRKYQRERLASDLEALQKETHALVRRYATLNSKYPEARLPAEIAGGGSGIGGDEDDGRFISHEEMERRVMARAKLDSEIDVTTDIIREREEEMIAIHRSLVELQGVFKDVAALVAEQDPEFKRVEEHLTDARDSAKAALDEVEEASESQKSSCVVM